MLPNGAPVDIALVLMSLRVGVDEPKDPEPEIDVKPWLERERRPDVPVQLRRASVLRFDGFRNVDALQRQQPFVAGIELLVVLKHQSHQFTTVD
jgi:hypothetical protein